jgi:RsiW-degrading membrane proteinase PrsW (M82 family)
MGGLQGNWALVLLLYAVLLAVAMTAHLVWVRRIARDVWRSSRHTAAKMALTTLLIVTPVISFFAVTIVRHFRGPLRGATLGRRDLVMPGIGALTVLACALSQTMRYSPDYRTWQTMLGFVPGFLAFYGVMQLIVYMAASVFGLSQRGFLSSRTHLVSVSILLATGVFM